MKAGSDLYLFLPVGEESYEQGSTDDSLDDLDAGGEYDGDLGEYSHWGDGDGDGDEGGVWCVPLWHAHLPSCALTNIVIPHGSPLCISHCG